MKLEATEDEAKIDYTPIDRYIYMNQRSAPFGAEILQIFSNRTNI